MLPENSVFNSTNALSFKRESLKGMVDSSWCKLFSLMQVKIMHLARDKKNPTHLKQLQLTLYWRIKHSLKKTQANFFPSITTSKTGNMSRIMSFPNSTSISYSHLFTLPQILNPLKKSHPWPDQSHWEFTFSLFFHPPVFHATKPFTNLSNSHFHFIKTHYIHFDSLWSHRALTSGQDRRMTRESICACYSL